ncbi:MAG: S8 family serine peptidase [Thermoplasmatota archaeon]|nr:S8/S53 family peptidase [Halobacteriales archaeon]
MHLRSFLSACLAIMAAGCAASPQGCDPCPFGPVPSQGAGDAVVVAVVDSGFDPYHYDFLASEMPQARDGDPANDLPLDQDPATWLPGYPAATAFASYDALRITLPDGPKAVPQKLHDADQKAWNGVKKSGADGVHMRWLPGTKVVGFVDFAGNGGFATDSHGVGTTSVSVGNLHGSCPECLFVFVNGPSEVANRWVEAQSWIDVQTNSWGTSSIGSALCAVPVCTGLPRDRVYSGSDTASQRNATERGQAIFFSAGNGLANDFTAPNPTLFSSQEGPDWIVTVGAVSPEDGSAYSGAGKPVDVAGVGDAYPSAGGGTVTADSTFGGTSNATPVTAGEYARALYLVRREMGGASRMQQGGTVARQAGGCIGEGSCAGWTVSADQLRHAFFAAANYTNPNMNAGGAKTVPASTKEATYMAEGHGSFMGRLDGEGALENETERIADLALGELPMPVPDLDEEQWFVADSFCRQGVWGSWTHGDYVEGNTTLPAPDPNWPTRSFYATSCPQVVGAVVTASRMAP